MYGQRLRPCFAGDHNPKDSWDLELSREGHKKVAKTLHCRGSWFKDEKIGHDLTYVGDQAPRR